MEEESEARRSYSCKLQSWDVDSGLSPHQSLSPWPWNQGSHSGVWKPPAWGIPRMPDKNVESGVLPRLLNQNLREWGLKL